MKQQERELLLKDLCARIPYGVKILHQGWNYEWDDELSTLERVTGIDEKFIYTKVINDNGEESSDRHIISLLDDKPYLFPLSSMTEEQKEEIEDKLTFPNNSDGGWIEILYNNKYDIPFWFVDFCNKNHFDYRGLIEKSLALDATGLNIYKEKQP